MSIDELKILGLSGAGATLFGALCLWLIDPTAADAKRLETAETALRRLPKPVATAPTTASDISLLMQQPVFVMSTGANAYTEKKIRLIGVSISPGRRAALVAVEGAEAQWMRVGEVQNEMVLLEVGGSAARFDTPVGPRTVGMDDPATSGGL